MTSNRILKDKGNTSGRVSAAISILSKNRVLCQKVCVFCIRMCFLETKLPLACVPTIFRKCRHHFQQAPTISLYTVLQHKFRFLEDCACLFTSVLLFLRGGPVTLLIFFLRSTQGRRSLDSSGATGDGVTESTARLVGVRPSKQRLTKQ